MLIVNTMIAAIGMIVLPLVAGYFVARKFKLSFGDFRRLFVAGALTFIASQVLHIPVVYGLTALFRNGLLPSVDPSITLLFNAVVLGLLAGIFEETARYVLFKTVRKSADTWNNGVVIGLGHGGVEAILLGILTLATMAQMIAMRDLKDFSVLGLPAAQISLVKQQIAVYWSQPAAMPLFGWMERVSAISLHVGLSILVLYSVVAHQRKWFWLALLWHAGVDALAVYLYPQMSAGTHQVAGTLGFELLVLVLSAGLLAFAMRLRNRFPLENEAVIE